ncbi:hypothetical protein [Sedimentimonas flavescens]|nr:hypothetical protein [Sedimentimonas flavescens]MCT2538469.1 hypothetical protein [Sedimentimonas flavescens]WBL34491.1 hypothetical protein O5O51_07250 [Sinirhodobacter sp. HNIBRBA609]
MRREVQAILKRHSNGLLHDALGAMSLCITFLGVLFIPGLF